MKKYEVDFWGRLVTYKNVDKFFNDIFILFCFRNRFKYRILRFYFRRKKSKDFKYSTKKVKKFFKKSYRKYYIWRLHTLMKFRIYYGDFNLKKFRKYIKVSLKRNLDFMTSLLLLLECRLDMLLYRTNLFKTPKEIRQYIKCGNVFVNNKQITNYKYQIYLNDIISLKKNINLYSIFVQNLKRKLIWYNYPRYLEINYQIMKFMLIFYPKQKDLVFTFKKDIRILRTFF